MQNLEYSKSGPEGPLLNVEACCIIYSVQDGQSSSVSRPVPQNPSLTAELCSAAGLPAHSLPAVAAIGPKGLRPLPSAVGVLIVGLLLIWLYDKNGGTFLPRPITGSP